jgi:DNA-directed RNA polymerase specialized sigma24 family protein
VKTTTPEWLADLLEVAGRLGPAHAFGYHTAEDMTQWCVAWGLELAPRCGPDRPLRGFLETHIRNRLLSVKRDWKGRREEQPA